MSDSCRPLSSELQHLLRLSLCRQATFPAHVSELIPTQPRPIRKGLCGSHSLRDPAGCGPSPFPPAHSAYAPSFCPFPGCNYEHLKSGDIFLQPPSETRNSVAFSTLFYFIYDIPLSYLFVGFVGLALLCNKHSVKASEPQSGTGNGSCPALVEQLAVHLHLYWVVGGGTLAGSNPWGQLYGFPLV